jgi:uncharacterized protein YidB (DUF937 family)
MGLLEQVVDGLVGRDGSGTAAAGSPMKNVLMALLSGNGQNPNQFGEQMQGRTAQGSGLGGVVASMGGLLGLIPAFEGAGLSHIVQSWIGNGTNLPVSSGQLASVFGQDRVNQMAGQAGMEPRDFL